METENKQEKYNIKKALVAFLNIDTIFKVNFNNFLFFVLICRASKIVVEVY